ncbi:MAG: T9SS type A sorting domain-containing protein [Hymenobacter sp.]|nr:MAG: T9SS type A sorting domain-containing protein [Hymenobacter sp.]
MQQIIRLVLASVVALVLWGVGPLAASAQVLRNTFAGGGAHSLSIHADGTLWATGSNSQGQLGDNTTTSRAAWVQIGTDTDWVQVVAGQSHSLALKANGALYAWGDNSQGQLGIGTTTNSNTPTAVAGTYTQLAAGYYHSLALGPNGTLYAWGDNDLGQLGDGTMADKSVPTATVGTYTRIAAGFYHSLGLRPDGTLWAWGAGSSGQLGTNSTANQPVPTAVGGGYVFVQIAAGAYFSLGLRNDGHIYSWGNNNLGQLGNGLTANTSAPAPVVGGKVYRQVAAGGFHGMGLRADGILETWGDNTQGQLGNNNNARVTEPTAVAGSGTYVQAVGGQNHSLALGADGTLYAWGANAQGQLGTPVAATSNLYLPTALGTALPTRSTAAGGAFGLAIKGDGTLWSWGDNAYGQLGDGTTTDRIRPLQVGTAHAWVQVVAGNHHALGLQANGSLWAWGDNSLGQLGTSNNAGTTTPSTTPVQISSGPYVRLAAGEAYSLALQADGTLFAWGSNEAGQLGTATNAGTTTPNPTAAVVPGQYAYMAAGGAHTLALQATGILYTWGANISGQLGPASGSGAFDPTPTALSTAAYTQVAAGRAHSLALQITGTLYAWGSNEAGQLGNTVNIGTVAANPLPAAVAGQYAQVAAGYARTLARRADGTIWAWGADDSGQLGLGTTAAAVSTPTQEITQATNWTTLAAGPLSKSSLVRTPSAQSFASAGLNDQGQLGDGTNTDAPRFDRLILLAAAAPLPVTLLRFEARRTGPATAALTWATATETSNAGFTVQKSTDGTAFSALGFVAGAGTTATTHTYAYTDGQAPGRSYYRLAQHDADGTTTYSPVAVVEGAAPSLTLVPNPAHGVVQVLGLAPEATLRVYDGLGRLVRPAATTLDVAGLPAGVYLVQATAPHQAPQTARLVVE